MGTWGVETGEAIGTHVTDSLAHIAVNDRTYLKRGGGQGLVVLWRLHAVHALTHKCTDLLRVLITLPQRSLSKDNLLLFFFFTFTLTLIFFPLPICFEWKLTQPPGPESSGIASRAVTPKISPGQILLFLAQSCCKIYRAKRGTMQSTEQITGLGWVFLCSKVLSV